MKQLWIFAGPNGSGKTTIVDHYVRNRIPIVNPDVIARELNPANVQAVALKAGKAASSKRELLLSKSITFGFETTLSGKSELQFMSKAKIKGYKINLIFISTDDPLKVNIYRVAERVQSGGHHIPTEDIIRRYKRSLENLPKALEIADRAYIIDNSQKHRKLCIVIENHSVKHKIKNLPNWLKEWKEYE
jgi:predicted ABC-type ATPase